MLNKIESEVQAEEIRRQIQELKKISVKIDKINWGY